MVPIFQEHKNLQKLQTWNKSHLIYSLQIISYSTTCGTKLSLPVI